MTSPAGETGGGGLVPIPGTRWSPNAYPLLDIAKDAVHGHAMIAEKVKEHAAMVAAERETQRAAHGAQIAATAAAAGPGG